MKRIAIVASILLATGACGETPEDMAPLLKDAWIRAAPPGSAVTAGYMVVANPAGSEIVIVGIECEDFDRAELHRTEIVDGRARMRPEPAVAVPPGAEAVFEPGGRHLMLHDPARPLVAGDVVQCTIALQDGARIGLTAEVRTGGAQDDHRHHEH